MTIVAELWSTDLQLMRQQATPSSPVVGQMTAAAPSLTTAAAPASSAAAYHSKPAADLQKLPEACAGCWQCRWTCLLCRPSSRPLQAAAAACTKAKHPWKPGHSEHLLTGPVLPWQQHTVW